MKTTNFSREQWVEISDMHICDVWAVELEKRAVIQGTIQAAADILRDRKYAKKRKAGEQEVNWLAKKAWGSGYQCQVAVSDEDFWFAHPFLNVLILI
jgi:hypothetical protein